MKPLLALLALVGGSILLGSTRGAAQTPLLPGHLMVRPHALATGTRTDSAGIHSLGWDNVYTQVYVPPQCVGPRRCPLVLHISGDLPPQIPYADHYGIIVLAVALSPGPMIDAKANGEVSTDPEVPHQSSEVPEESSLWEWTRLVDSALTYVLQHFAIDPDKIALTGNSLHGFDAMLLGRTNLDVFSRILPTSPVAGIPPGGGPPNPHAQFYASGGVAEPSFLRNAINFVHQVRQEGYSATFVLEPRPHVSYSLGDIARRLRWLHESWAAPETTRATPQPAPPLLLTPDMVRRWTTFWRRLLQESDSIFGKSASTATRTAYLKEYPMWLGQEPVWLQMTDLPALAAASPSVAAALQAAGLTAKQAEEYRLTLLSAAAMLGLQHANLQGRAKEIVAAVTPTSVLGRNIALLATNGELIKALDAEAFFPDAVSWLSIP